MAYTRPVPTEPVSPSPILAYLDDALERVLPEAEYSRLTGHDQAVAATTSAGDFHRCLHCARWAVTLADRSGHGGAAGIAAGLKKVVEELHDTWSGVRFGSIVRDSPVVTDVEVRWVDQALQTASAVAEDQGWEAVPWEQLVEELVALEPESD